MKINDLKNKLCKKNIDYAKRNDISYDDSYKNAVIFNEIAGNFHKKSLDNIKNNHKKDWLPRLNKTHQNVNNAKEMQSSNSSDALLMNIFCHPDINKWKGLKDLLSVTTFDPEFGFEPKLELNDDSKDKTEIDLKLGNILCEAKLTEADFTKKEVNILEKYKRFEEFFEDLIPVINNKYDNYQIIRNLIASISNDCKHILLSDERRPDLARRYYETVGYLKKATHRKSCRVVFWQEIARVCGKDLKDFLLEKYGIC